MMKQLEYNYTLDCASCDLIAAQITDFCSSLKLERKELRQP